jgi:hypothetical protein
MRAILLQLFYGDGTLHDVNHTAKIREVSMVAVAVGANNQTSSLKHITRKLDTT